MAGGNSRSVGIAFDDPQLYEIWLNGGLTRVMESNGKFTFPTINTYLGVTAITAHAGGGQGSATALTGEYNLITVSATAGDSVVLPTPALGKPCRVKVSSAAAASVAVFPPTGGTINGLAANASMSLLPGAEVIFWGTSATAWHCESGINPSAGQVAAPNNIHTLGSKPLATSDGTDYTVVATEVIVAEILVTTSLLATGVALFNGSAVAGNVKVGLFDSTGAVIATSASTAQSGTDAYQLIAFTAPVYLKGPATYYIGAIGDTGGGTSKINTHILGSGLAAKQTGQVYATGFTSIAALITTQRAAATPFITALGPMASLY